VEALFLYSLVKLVILEDNPVQAVAAVEVMIP
jgi:hypothetical protein